MGEGRGWGAEVRKEGHMDGAGGVDGEVVIKEGPGWTISFTSPCKLWQSCRETEDFPGVWCVRVCVGVRACVRAC
eukprot:12928977-Prorocentrum_lima.AAC.1